MTHQKKHLRTNKKGKRFVAGKMQWQGREVIGVNGSSRPIHPAFAFKTRKSTVIRLKDGTIIRFEKSVFNPKGMVMKK